MGNNQASQLVSACEKKDFEGIKYLLLDDKVDINASVYLKKEIPTFNTFPLNYIIYDSIQYTPLRAAVEVSSFPMVQMLIEKVLKKKKI